MQRRSPSLLALLPALVASGCCGPCAGLFTPGSGPTPAASSAPPGTGASIGGATGSVTATSAPESPASSTRHPLFPKRRDYLRPPIRVTSNGADVDQLPRAGLVTASAAFDEMSAAEADGPRGGLVACKLRVLSRFDQLRDSDVTVNMKIGARETIEHKGPEDSDVTHFTLPRATWSAGEAIEIRARDRDVFSFDEIGTLTTVSNGKLPLTLQNANMAVECRAWTPEQVEERARVRGASLTAAITRVRAGKPAPGQPGWGHALAGFDAAWTELDLLSALVGSADPRVKTAGAELEKLEDEWTVAATRSVTAELAKLPPAGKSPVRLPEVDVTVLGVSCDAARIAALGAATKWPTVRDLAAKRPCLVEVTAKRTTPAGSLFLFPVNHVEAHLVLADGSEVPLKDLALLDARGTSIEDIHFSPAPGDTFSVPFVPAADVPLGTHPGSPPDNQSPRPVLLRFTRPTRQDASSLARFDG